MADVGRIFKAYDVRGLVPQEIDEPTAQAIGTAFAEEISSEAEQPTVVIGYDMRPSSPGLAEAFGTGVRATGADVIDIGLAATDQLYYASSSLDLPAAMFTASHNPATYNGIKMCLAGAVALSAATGLDAIRDRVLQPEEDPLPPGSQPPTLPGSVERRDVLGAYVAHLHAMVPVRGRRLKVVVDAGNGMAGHTVPAVFAGLDVDLTAMYFELDGTFPNHEANPINPENMRDLTAAVVRERADLGLAFDGDADRCFAVDERGQLVSPSALTAMIAVRALEQEPGARIVHNLITSKAVPEIVARHGGVPVRTKVGHSLIKAVMAERDAVFGGEHSGHFYFRDFWFADSGMLAALHLLAALAASDRPLSALMAGYDPYVGSGELNLTVDDPVAAAARVAEVFAAEPGVRIDDLDGLTVLGGDWWFNVRPSNTEPVLRLNVEGDNDNVMREIRDRVLSLMRR